MEYQTYRLFRGMLGQTPDPLPRKSSSPGQLPGGCQYMAKGGAHYIFSFVDYGQVSFIHKRSDALKNFYEFLFLAFPFETRHDATCMQSGRLIPYQGGTSGCPGVKLKP